MQNYDDAGWEIYIEIAFLLLLLSFFFFSVQTAFKGYCLLVVKAHGVLVLIHQKDCALLSGAARSSSSPFRIRAFIISLGIYK